MFNLFIPFPSTFVDKQNELELPCSVSKSRERKRRQGQQQQQGGMMTQISGVRKVSHTPSISGSSSNRFGVKTDQEELLSKVSDRGKNNSVTIVCLAGSNTHILTSLIGAGGHQQMGPEYLQGGRALPQSTAHMHNVHHLSGQSPASLFFSSFQLVKSEIAPKAISAQIDKPRTGCSIF